MRCSEKCVVETKRMDGEDVPPDPHAELRLLRRVCAEALIMQDRADEVVKGVRDRQSFATLTRRGGPLVRRFFDLRDQLPERCLDPDLDRLRSAVESILHHHALAVSTALDLLACEWRSERIARQVDALGDLGAPARWLEEIYAELAEMPGARRAGESAPVVPAF